MSGYNIKMSGAWSSSEAFPFGGAEVVAKVGGKRRGGQMKEEKEVMIAGQKPAEVGEAAGAAAAAMEAGRRRRKSHKKSHKKTAGKRHGGQEAGRRPRKSHKASRKHRSRKH